jgi:hypothetical protein
MACRGQGLRCSGVPSRLVPVPSGPRSPDRLHRAATSGRPSCASDPWLSAAVPRAWTEMVSQQAVPSGSAPGVAAAPSSEAVRLGRRGVGLRTSRLGLCRRWR